MANKRLVWQIFPPFLVILVCALIAVTWTISRELETFQLNQATRDLEARALLAGEQLSGNVNQEGTATVDRLSKELGKKISTRITVILSDGTVIGDSEENPQQMDNHAGRPEIAVALQGKTGTATRFSQTLQQNMLYVAIPAFEKGQVTGSIRTALSMSELERTLAKITWKLVGGGLAVAMIAALVALAVSRRISRAPGRVATRRRKLRPGQSRPSTYRARQLPR